ncbi:hypothetical protein U9M48_025106 [Paspalum notatum var. saurae]|uniref:Uncharacterized protein n=1 Tax=Paspalum notatum var. saurae TaxID=547442 RepID=A0AAQ3TRY4_PASNO
MMPRGIRPPHPREHIPPVLLARHSHPRRPSPLPPLATNSTRTAHTLPLQQQQQQQRRLRGSRAHDSSRARRPLSPRLGGVGSLIPTGKNTTNGGVPREGSRAYKESQPAHDDLQCTHAVSLELVLWWRPGRRRAA